MAGQSEADGSLGREIECELGERDILGFPKCSLLDFRSVGIVKIAAFG
jgi:hypothetical protein